MVDDGASGQLGSFAVAESSCDSDFLLAYIQTTARRRTPELEAYAVRTEIYNATTGV